MDSVIFSRIVSTTCYIKQEEDSTKHTNHMALVRFDLGVLELLGYLQ
jgi:hypothetical protein